MTNELLIPEIKLTKAGIADAGARMAQIVDENGDVNPLSAYIRLRALRDAIDVALDGLKGTALDAAERDPQESLHGVSWQIRVGATKYDYGNDPVWAELQASEKATAGQRRKREAFLKSLPNDMVDPETGEFVSPAAVVDVGAATLALIFPKE